MTTMLITAKKKTHPPNPANSHEPDGVRHFNAKQFQAFALVENFARKVQQRGVLRVPPLLLDLSGPAGSGKTTWVRITRAHINKLTGSNFIQTTAPTGIAAHLSGGETLHSLLHLPIGKSRLEPLDENKLRQLQEKFRDIHLLIVDEKSMVGQSLLSFVNWRLKEIRPGSRHLAFAGFSLVLLGDWKQLAPVGDRSLYEAKTKGSQGHHLYRLFTNAIIFDEVHRQGSIDQASFRDELRRLADGHFTQQDWVRWKTRALENLPIPEREAFLKHGILACARKRDMIQHNIQKVKDLGRPIAVIAAQNQPSTSSTASAEQSSGLPNHLLLSPGALVRLTANLWTAGGLVNGAEGTVHSILYLPGQAPPELPAGVIVIFKDYKGPPFLTDVPGSVPVHPISRTWRVDSVTQSRRMLPLLLGYALSIHKIQGSTCDKVILHAGPREFTLGLMLVGTTRTKTIQDLAFQPFPSWDRFEQIPRSPALYRRRQEEERLRQLEKKTVSKNKVVIRLSTRRHRPYIDPLESTNWLDLETRPIVPK